MNHLKIIVFSLLFALAGKSAYAQFGMGKIEEIEQVQSRKLIVVTEEPREKIIKKLTKKHKDTELSNYKAALEEYNNEMKEVVEKFWPWKENGIEYMTFKQVEELKKKNSKDYAVIYCISKEASSFSYGYNTTDGLSWSWNMKEESDDRDFFDYFTDMVVNRIEDLKSTPVYETPLPDIFPTKASLVFGINNTKTYFDYRIRKKKNKEKINALDMINEQIAENAPKLKTMTLLLRKDWLNKDLPASAVKYSYPFKYKVCTKEEMDEAIVNREANTAYLVILPYVNSTSYSNSITYIHYIYNAETDEMMAMARPSIGSMIGAAYIGGKAGKRTIEKKNLEKFKDEINGKK